MEKAITYRGAREHWVNAYHFDQVPASAAQWEALANAVWALEQPCFGLDVTWEHAYGHEPGTPPLWVWATDPLPSGEGGPAGTYTVQGADNPCPGDAAGTMRYGTTQRSIKGKPIYLRNYYHGVYWNGTPDTWSPSQIGRFNVLASAMVNGIAASGTTFHRAGPRGAVAQNHQAGTFITTRTLKHRGKRHSYTKVPAELFPWKSPGTPPIIID